MGCRLCGGHIDSHKGYVRVNKYKCGIRRKQSFYHLKCFNKEFILRDVKGNCVCGKRVNLMEDTHYVNTSFIPIERYSSHNTSHINKFHQKCFRKYWMPYQRKKHKPKPKPKPFIKSHTAPSTIFTGYRHSYFNDDTTTAGGSYSWRFR